MEGATNGKEAGIDPANLEIVDIKDKSLSFRIKFDNPAAISLSDQSFNDRLKIRFRGRFRG
jgi:hypothetical protein